MSLPLPSSSQSVDYHPFDQTNNETRNDPKKESEENQINNEDINDDSTIHTSPWPTDYDDENHTSSLSPSSRKWSVFLYSLTTVLLFADQNLLAPNLTAAASDFNFTNQERDDKLGGDIAIAFFLLGAPASFVIGCMADHDTPYPSFRSKLFALTVFIGEGACFYTYWTTTYTQLYICRALTGISVGGASPLIYSVLGDLFESSQRPLVSAMVGMGTGVGIGLGQGIAGFLGPRYGWRFPFLVVSVPALLYAVLLWFTVTDPERGGKEGVVLAKRQQMQQQQQSLRSFAENEHHSIVHEKIPNNPQFETTSTTTTQHSKIKKMLNETIKPHIQTFHSLLKTPSVLLCIIQGAPGCIPWGIINTYLNDYLSQDVGLSVEQATFVVLVFGVGTFIGQFVGGAYGTHLYQKDVRYPNLLSGTMAIVGCIPLWILINYDITPENDDTKAKVTWYMLTSSLISGVGASVTGPIVKATLTNVTIPTSRGQAFALLNTFDDFGRGLGPMFIAMLIRTFGSRRKAFNVGVGGWILCGFINGALFCTVVRDEGYVQDVVASRMMMLDNGVVVDEEDGEGEEEEQRDLLEMIERQKEN